MDNRFAVTPAATSPAMQSLAVNGNRFLADGTAPTITEMRTLLQALYVGKVIFKDPNTAAVSFFPFVRMRLDSQSFCKLLILPLIGC